MTEYSPGVPLGAWLAELPDERLIRLLELRPDLTQPPPGTVAALAARAAARQSVKAATDDLDFLRLTVLDALLVLHAETAAVPLTKLVELIGERATEDAVIAAVDDLRERALVWGDARGAGGRRGRRGPALVSRAGHCRRNRRHRPGDRGSARRTRRTTVRTAAEAARGLADGPHARCSAGHTAGSPGAAPAGDGATASGGRRNRDPAANGRPGAARRTSRAGAADATRPRGVENDRGRRRRRGRRCCDRSAARGRAGARNTGRRTGSRAAQRRARSARRQAADEGDGHRRTPARPDSRGGVGGRAHRRGPAGTGAARRRGPVLDANGRRRPIRRVSFGVQVAAVGLDVAGLARQAQPDRQPGT